MEQNHISIMPEPATDEPASSSTRDLIEFDPVALRYRIDGWTPDKQREYVETLADTGLARVAAARVGMTEQSAARLRRRPDARAFDLACAAAMRIGARRIGSIAFERAIEGTIKRHYYHGELKSEERVFDNRLLVYLLGKLDHLLDPPEEAKAVAEDWQPWMEAIEAGLPAPPAAEEPEEEQEEEDDFTGEEVWYDNRGTYWTSFPPPDDFDGDERTSGSRGYRRTLTPAEVAAYEAEVDRDEEQARQEQCARRDRFFGFEGASFSPQGS